MRFSLFGTLLVVLLTVPDALGAPTAEYRFGPGDVIEVTVTPQKDFNRIVTVQPDGKISFPLVGPFQAAGLTGMQLAEKLRVGLDAELLDPEVTVSLKELGKQAVPQVSLLGAVSHPKVYEIREGTTLAELLAMGGGPTSLADLRRITITRADRSVLTLDMAQTDLTGRVERNVTLQPGDIVVVPEGGPATVLVLGAVTKPASYAIQREARLMDAFSLAGGLTEKADPRRVTLTRPGAAGPQTLDLQPLLIEGNSADLDLNILLQPGDVIFVPETTQQMYVLGRVVRPNIYQIRPEDRVLDALVMAGGATGDGDISKAVLIRRDTKGQPMAKPLDLKKMMAKGKMAENELLLPGDVLYVPDRKARRSLGETTSVISNLFWPLNGLLNIFR